MSKKKDKEIEEKKRIKKEKSKKSFNLGKQKKKTEAIVTKKISLKSLFLVKLSSIIKKQQFKKIAALILVVLFVVMVIVPVGIYLYSPLWSITKPIFEKIPYPVAFVGERRDVITTKELLYNVKSVRKFYESQNLEEKGLRVDFTTDDGKMRLKIKEREVLDKHVEDKIIVQLANRYGIEVTTEDAQKELDNLIKLAGSKKAVELKLSALYGWGIDDLRDKVVVYQMYTKKLLEKYSDISKKQKEYLEMEKAAKELNKEGSNFREIAEKYSEGDSATNGGELGWFPLDKINFEVADEIGDYDKGQISGIITSRLGFHIVQLQDIREIESVLTADDELSGLKKGDTIKKKEIKLRQIFKKGISFVKWIKREKQKTKVLILMKDFKWDQAEGQVIFADEKMRLLEKRIRVRSNGDPSIKLEYN